ncbi:hypothetical protein JZU46_04640 [bacterium]|nr:hypothetical protein [bacterium]
MGQDNSNSVKVDTSKIIWLIQVETATGIIYNTKISYEDVKNLKLTHPHLINEELKGVISRYVMPFTLDKFKKDVLKYVYIKRKHTKND